MEIENKYKYFAFISYKREDEEWAKKLQYKLEHYKLPSNLNGRTDLPKEIRPIFRDQSDLAGGVLADEINDALEHSKFLIVICSPRAAQSEWVGKEVQAFMDMGRADKIIPFIIGGTAHAQNPQDECFPLSLREMPPHQELLGVNINEIGRDAAAVKVVAQMFGLKFDELWQRHEKEKRNRRRFLFSGITIFAMLILGFTGWIWRQNVEIKHQNTKIKEKEWKMMENLSRAVAEKACDLVNEGDSYLAQRLLLEVLPNNLTDSTKPYTLEADNTLRYAIFKNSAILDHGDYNDAVFSSDGKKIASITSSMIKIWNVENGQLLHVLGPIKDLGDNIVFNSDDNQVYFSQGATVFLWNPLKNTKTKMIHISSHFNISPDFKRLVTGVNLVSDYQKRDEVSHFIEYWDLENQRIINTFTGHTSYVNSFDFSPDGKFFVSASSDGTAIVWDLELENPIHVLDNFKSSVTSAAFSPDGKRIITVSLDGIIKVWNVSTGDVVFEKNEYKIDEKAVYSPNGEQIIASTRDGFVVVLDAETGELMERFSYEGRFTSSIRISPDGRKILISSHSQLAVLDMESEMSMRFIEIKDKYTLMKWDTKISRSQRIIIAPQYDYSLKINDLEIPIMETIEAYEDRVSIVQFSPDNKKLATVSEDGFIQMRNAETGELIAAITSQNEIINATFSIDGKKFASYSEDGAIEIRNVDDLSIINSWLVDTGASVDCPASISFSPDGKQILIAFGDDNNIYKLSFDAMSGNVLKVDKVHDFDSRIYFISFSPDSKRIVAIVEEQICILDSDNGKLIDAIHAIGGNDFVDSGLDLCSICNDADKLIVGFNGFVGVYSLSKDIIVLGAGGPYQEHFSSLDNTHRRIMESFSFSSNGERIACGYSDGTVRIWYFPPLQDLIDQTRERFKDRPLTPEERRTYYLE